MLCFDFRRNYTTCIKQIIRYSKSSVTIAAHIERKFSYLFTLLRANSVIPLVSVSYSFITQKASNSETVLICLLSLYIVPIFIGFCFYLNLYLSAWSAYSASASRTHRHTHIHVCACTQIHRHTQTHIRAYPEYGGLQQASVPQQHLYKYKHMQGTQYKPRHAQRKSSAIAWICLAGFGKVYYSAGCLVKRIVYNQFPLHYSAVVALQAVAIYAVIFLGGFFFPCKHSWHSCEITAILSGDGLPVGTTNSFPQASH